jgi:hypothetical membrane protein
MEKKRNWFPVRLDRVALIGGLVWILSVVFLLGQVIAQSAWRGTQYSVLNDAISDLGVTVCGTVSIGGVPGYYCSPLHDVMNASFILTGAFIALGAYLTRAAWPWNKKMRAGMVLIALAGLGKAVAGLNPANVDFTLHTIGSLGIPVGDIGLVLIGLGFRKRIRWVAALSLAMGVVGFLGFIYFLVGNSLPGLWERVGSYPIIFWCMAMGSLFLFRWSGRTNLDGPRTRPRAMMMMTTTTKKGTAMAASPGVELSDVVGREAERWGRDSLW